MNLAIIDDNQEYIEIVKNKLLQLELTYDVITYTNSQEYKYDLIKKRTNFDIVIMDIEIDELTGIDLAIETNRILPYCQIIYLTSYIQYVSDVYETEHIYYINKKDFDKYFPLAINKAIILTNKRNAEILTVSWNKVHYEIKEDKIIYIERQKKVSFIYTKENCIKTSNPINKLLPLLNQNFIRCHESYLVNMNYISTINKSNIILITNHTIPLSRKYVNDVKRLYSLFLSK